MPCLHDSEGEDEPASESMPDLANQEDVHMYQS